MGTSKDYYETIMRDYQAYGRGRSLEQYCRDEGVDYKWIEKAKGQYSTPSSVQPSGKGKKNRKSPGLVQLQVEDEAEVTAKEPAEAGSGPQPAEAAIAGTWKVLSLTVMTPRGHEIEIMTSDPEAVSELLSQFTA